MTLGDEVLYALLPIWLVRSTSIETERIFASWNTCYLDICG